MLVTDSLENLAQGPGLSVLPDGLQINAFSLDALGRQRQEARGWEARVGQPRVLQYCFKIQTIKKNYFTGEKKNWSLHCL